MNISDIHLLYDYNYWANKLIMTTAAQLTPEQFAEPLGYSFGGLRGTLIHTLDTEHSWRHIFQTSRVIEYDLADTEPFPTLDAIADYWRKDEADMRAYLNSLQDSDMENILRYDIPDGKRERVLWHCLVHVVNHGTQHRSECAVMLTDFGHSPGNIDRTRFLNERAGIV
jgi:uncharacterized damage-inducible protein DinB